MLEGCSPESAGRPHEAVGNGSPRWMTASPARASGPGDRTRRTGRLFRRTRGFALERTSDLRRRSFPIFQGLAVSGVRAFLESPSDRAESPRKVPETEAPGGARSSRAEPTDRAARRCWRGCPCAVSSAVAAEGSRVPTDRVGLMCTRSKLISGLCCGPVAGAPCPFARVHEFRIEFRVGRGYEGADGAVGQRCGSPGHRPVRIAGRSRRGGHGPGLPRTAVAVGQPGPRVGSRVLPG